jgi:hypothetical protein
MLMPKLGTNMLRELHTGIVNLVHHGLDVFPILSSGASITQLLDESVLDNVAFEQIGVFLDNVWEACVQPS